MRYNADIQKRADKMARENGFFCATYIGRTEDKLVFIARGEDNEPRCTGLPCYITFKNNKLRFERSLNFCKYRGKLRYHYPAKGRALLETYRQMCDYDNFAGEDDARLIREIVSLSRGGGYETPMSITDICEALEIAERYNMTVEVYPDYSTTYFGCDDRCNGCACFIKVVQGRLPERRYMIID